MQPVIQNAEYPFELLFAERPTSTIPEISFNPDVDQVQNAICKLVQGQQIAHPLYLKRSVHKLPFKDALLIVPTETGFSACLNSTEPQNNKKKKVDTKVQKVMHFEFSKDKEQLRTSQFGRLLFDFDKNNSRLVHRLSISQILDKQKCPFYPKNYFYVQYEGKKGPKVAIYQEYVSQTLASIDDFSKIGHTTQCQWIQTIIQAILTMHSLGLVHRDVKPANVLLSERGPLLTDFDVACFSGDAQEAQKKVGTKGWRPPKVEASPQETRDLWGVGMLIHYIANNGFEMEFQMAQSIDDQPGMQESLEAMSQRPHLEQYQNLKEVSYALTYPDPGERTSLKMASLAVDKISKVP